MGESSAGKYTNEEIGLTYTYPTTWDVAKSASELAAETEVEQRTRDVLSACSLVLLRLAPSASEEAKAGTQAAVTQNITLRAVDQTCLGLPAPASVTDRLGAEKLGAYLQMLGAFGELRSTNLVMRGGHLFSEYSGLVGEHPENQPLLQRRNEAVAVTRHRKLLFIWSWIAPNGVELATLPVTSVSFEGDPPIDLLVTSIIAQH